MKDKFYILGIETSCDETAASVYRCDIELSNIVSTQIPIHNKYGGVVPEVASRNHTMDLPSVVKDALQKANITCKDLNYIAVTYGAGLSGALLTGLSFAKSMAYGLDIMLIGVNHIQAHIDANYIENKSLKPPFIALVVSGGHTNVVRVEDYAHYYSLFATLDDACGEAFDKIARILELGYPGGPVVEQYANNGIPNIEFFKSDTNNRTIDYISYSGLKTAVINYVHKLKQNNKLIDDSLKSNICASFLKYATNILLNPTLQAVKKYNANTLVLAGGVAANITLRNALSVALKSVGAKLIVPSIKYCTDNASMICMRAYNIITNTDNFRHDKVWYNLNVNSNLKISDNL